MSKPYCANCASPVGTTHALTCPENTQMRWDGIDPRTLERVMDRPGIVRPSQCGLIRRAVVITDAAELEDWPELERARRRDRPTQS